MKYFLVKVIKFLNCFYSYKLHMRLQGLFNLIYSSWLQCLLNEGDKILFHAPVQLKGGEYISLGNNVVFGRNCILTAWDRYENQIFKPNIKVGENCNFGEYNHITAINNIQIGDNVLTGRWVTIKDNSHGEIEKQTLKIPPIKRQLYSKGPVVIEDNVWIGDKVTILPNVHIGTGVIIGANTVVTKDIPDYSIVAGNPAKIIKQL